MRHAGHWSGACHFHSCSLPRTPNAPTGAFRYGYFIGGDYESVTRFDVRRVAGFVRHSDAHVTNCLLPLGVSGGCLLL